jgi:PadR family transcriptional regulator PadR
LTRLKNNSLLSYNWVESTSGPPRKYYTLTEEGKGMVRQLDTTWKELAYAIETSKQTKQ